MLRVDEPFDQPEAFSVEDEKFDRIYPSAIRKLSGLFWTPVAVAAEAARLLVRSPGTHVLDVGCGSGKFCLVAATLTDGRFTGVDRRAELIDSARAAASTLGLNEIDFVHADIVNVPFTSYDAFYVFNPFEENMHGHKIDSDVPLSPALFKQYTLYVADQLGSCPDGTRVVTYAGYGDEIPRCYECELALFNDDLKLWTKVREYDPDAERLSIHTRRSYRGSLGWSSPRRQP